MIRVLSLIAVAVLVFSASRLVIRTLPGDPLDTLIAETGTKLPREELQKEFGLDRPFLPALSEDLKKALRGDLGKSLISREPIFQLILRRFSATARLIFVSVTLALAASLGIGLIAAARPQGRMDRLCTLHGLVASALPTPWIGPILIYLFAVLIPIFEVSQSIWLPSITLAILFSGLWSRLVRSRVRETLRTGAAPGARARGVPEWKVIFKYGLAPASGSLVATLGTQVGVLLGGTFVTEVIFDWPGMGSLLVSSVLHRDYPVVEAAIFIGALTSVLGTFIGDWAQRAVDPRRELL